MKTSRKQMCERSTSGGGRQRAQLTYAWFLNHVRGSGGIDSRWRAVVKRISTAVPSKRGIIMFYCGSSLAAEVSSVIAASAVGS
jgi:hypothetical protein